MIGAAKHLDKELEVLHRFVRVINDELMEIEADQKHVLDCWKIGRNRLWPNRLWPNLKF